ncbi:MAG TPA: trypsin-like peptidase domain-containing protein [Gemmatimonadaceae bacterium]|nr:trypsin-like peptidase domain-containing protein [Gemmatimonadaceae bacterium]
MTNASLAPSALQSMSDALAAAVGSAAESLVAIHARRRIPASGIHWRDGVLVATSHTIRKEEDIEVTLHGGRTARATLAGRDPGTDLAVLRLEGSAPPPASLAGEAGLAVGSLVVAAGRPGADVTAALGIVAELGGEYRTWAGGTIDRYVRLDITVQDGFSGGALLAAAGRVVGVNTSALARGSAVAIPIPTVERVMKQLLATGRVARAYAGLALQPVVLPPAQAERLGARAGLLVVGVEPDGPAERAGIILGDVLLSVNGKSVSDPRELLALLTSDRVGQTIPMRFARGGNAIDLSLTVGERPRRAG